MYSLAQLIAFIDSSKYILLFLGSFFEGTIVMMTGGLLYRLGVVQFWPMYGALFLGDFLSDLAWYGIGYFGARQALLRWGGIIGATPQVIDKVEGRFHKYHTWILAASKLTMGFGLAAVTLSVAGMLRVSLRRYIIINLLCGVVWVSFVVLVGYYFGNLFVLIPPSYRVAFIIAALICALLFLGFVNRRLRTIDW